MKANGAIKDSMGNLLFPLQRKGPARMYMVAGTTDKFFVTSSTTGKDEHNMSCDFLSDTGKGWEESGEYCDKAKAEELFARLSQDK
jgi:hypothetical protein